MRDLNATITPSGKVCANGTLSFYKDDMNYTDHAIVDLFWVDLIMKNPLDAEVSLSNVTVVVQEKSPLEGSTVRDFVEVETIKEVTLGPKATTSVSRMSAYISEI